MKNESVCSVPRCRQPAVMGYIERRLCEHHWQLIAGDDPAVEAKALDALGLVRIAGDVVEISGDKPRRRRDLKES